MHKCIFAHFVATHKVACVCLQMYILPTHLCTYLRSEKGDLAHCSRALIGVDSTRRKNNIALKINALLGPFLLFYSFSYFYLQLRFVFCVFFDFMQIQ